MIWETNGGGDIKFEIAPAETGYDIHVSRNAFRVVDTWIRLTVVDRDVYPIVRQIFAGERDLYRDTFKPQNETGTWTSITLVSSSGSQHKIDHIKPGGDLGVLPRFVTRVLDEG
ncbi:MAG: hypothetical protein KJ970_07280 [Candidatus Eisenbacteria bacterium]|uniref:Uncharacterized protein n=1 Tax=Eiseniibacteriota bacterium TaxID=2212470 RepID=A0A948W644_UNCEI|nr:hypothetical protein [Candidatus Eisenbacteria bacterium]MBU1948476.1 hypothetical protein [Candidatus Eisenbacteria bacterium]MBU2690715.1 hypothetical protein [Candidatus Eisenbacteria bacterium]